MPIFSLKFEYLGNKLWYQKVLILLWFCELYQIDWSFWKIVLTMEYKQGQNYQGLILNEIYYIHKIISAFFSVGVICQKLYFN